MSTAIDTITVGGTPDRRLVLSNSQVARVLSIGTSWNVLRIGLRLAFDDLGVTPQSVPRLFVGVLANPSAGLANGPLNAATSHFVGLITAYVAWTRVAGPPVAYTYGTFGGYGKKVGATITAVGGTSNTMYFSGTPATRRPGLIVQITKGSPNFTVELVMNSSTLVHDVPLAGNLVTAIEAGTLAQADTALEAASGGAYNSALSGAVAVNEAVDGFLNAVCVAWNTVDPVCRISEILWRKIS